MNRAQHPWWAVLLFFVLIIPAALAAQTTCDDGSGPLNSTQPQGLSPEAIVERFAAKEQIFKEARDHYTYTQDITVQTLEGNTPDGEFRQVWDVTYDDKGKRLENVTFAPQNTLQRVTMTKEDYDDIRNRLPFVMTTDDLPVYDVHYAGQQHVDEIETYVFDVAPKKVEKDRRYFQGRIWVDNHDFQIVKTCGRNVPDTHGSGKRSDAGKENLSPKFVTYREQIDGQYWFPTYTRADDMLHFSNGDIHIREIIKYTNYKRFGSHSRIIFQGEAQNPPNQQNPPKPK